MAGRCAASNMSMAFRTPSGSAPQRHEMLAFQSSGFGRRLLEDVERDVEHDRPGAAGHHGFPGLAHRERNHLAARRLEYALAHGAHRGREVRLVVAVELLERTAIELAGRNVAGHGQERHGVEICVGERDRQVGGARAARRERGGRLARDAVVAVRHEAGDGLVVHRNGLDVVRALVQRIDELDVAVPAQAERIRHLLAHQIVDDHLAAVEHVLRHCGLFS
jgi:hypothetical protein